MVIDRDADKIMVGIVALQCRNTVSHGKTVRHTLKPGFHSNAIACVGKQPIMVATASTEHSYWLALASVA